jgi:hypothetical protein
MTYEPDKAQKPHINILFQLKSIGYTNLGDKSTKIFSSNAKLRKRQHLILLMVVRYDFCM